MMSGWLLIFILFSLLFAVSCKDSFSSTGVPCYMHPAGDGCHYRLKPDSDACTTPSERIRLNEGIIIVNRTLVSLEKQLIRLGIIPPDNACSELPSVENGGVVYSDLNLAPGASGRYVCNEGYLLITFYDSYKFTCTEEGIWDGNVTEVPVACQLAADRCDSPTTVLNGTIVYMNDDPESIFIGDSIKYFCEQGNELQGPKERYCLRNGNWSGIEPLCVAVESGNKGGGAKKGRQVIGASVGSGITILVLIIVVVTLILSVLIYRRNRKRDTVTKDSIIKNDRLAEPSTDSSFSSSLIISEDYSEEWDEDNVAVHTKSISKKASRKKDYRSTQHTFDQSGNESSL